MTTNLAQIEAEYKSAQYILELINKLDDDTENSSVAFDAEEELLQMDHNIIVPLLFQLLKAKGTRYKIQVAIVKLFYDLEPDLQKEHVELFLSMLENNDEILMTVALLRVLSTLPYTFQIYSAIIKHLYSKYPFVVSTAIELTVNFNRLDFIYKLKELIKSDHYKWLISENSNMTVNIIKSLSYIDHSESPIIIQELVLFYKRFLTHSLEGIRHITIASIKLSKLPELQKIELYKTCLSDQFKDVRIRSIKNLSVIDEGIFILIDNLKSKKYNNQMMIITVLIEIYNSPITEYIKPTIIKAFVDGLSIPSPSTRKYCAFALGKLKNKKTIQGLEISMFSERIPRIKNEMRKALQLIRNQRELNIAIQVLKKEEGD